MIVGAGTDRAQCWPTAEQELLLRAALDRGEEAAANWLAWLTERGIEDLDAHSLHLLPAIYDNLHEIDAGAPEMSRLKGTYRYTWYRNQELLRDILPVCRALTAAGIETMALDDVALAARYYRDYGCRPIAAVRILVRRKQADAAVAVLQGLGWRAGMKSLERCLQGRSTLDVWKPGSRQATLHWRAFDAWLTGDQEDLVWAAAEPLVLGDAVTRVLCPADQLVRLCGFGVRRAAVPPTQWVVDSVAVLRSSADSLVWDRVVAVAGAAQVSHAVADALSYLRDHHAVAIPSQVLARLRAAPVSHMEAAEYELRLQTPTLRRRLAVHWHRYVAGADGASTPRALVGFPAYLRQVWDLDHLWEVPLRAVRSSRYSLSFRRRA